MVEPLSGAEPGTQPDVVADVGADVAELVRTVRTAAGLTQAELARRAETTQSMVARYESGAVSPTVRALARVVSACGHTLQLSTAELPAATFGDRVRPQPGISDYLGRPDSGWVPGPTPRPKAGRQVLGQ